MLLINLNIIFYALTNLRGFLIFKSEPRSDNLALIANNTIAFSLTSKEIKSKPYTIQKKSFISYPLHYNQLKYKDDISEQTFRAYPIITKLKLQYSDLILTLFKVINEIEISNLIGLQFKRKKTKFYIRILGLIGIISKYQFLIKYAYIWNNVKNVLTIFSYRKLIKQMFFRLHSSLLIELKQLCMRFFFKLQKKKIFIKKSKKYFIKTKATPKFNFIFKSAQIIN